MKSGFMTQLDVELIDDAIWMLKSPLVYCSQHLAEIIQVPIGFQTDFCSVPKVPIIYEKWGDRAHREGVLHDYVYCKDSIPVVQFDTANELLREAMISRGVHVDIYEPMYWAVCCFGHKYFHKRNVMDQFPAAVT
jgi:hypothetical protein